MPYTRPNSPLLGTISQIEQALDLFGPANDDEVRLRLRIEEAIEAKYEAIYARADRPTATVVSFNLGKIKD